MSRFKTIHIVFIVGTVFNVAVMFKKTAFTYSTTRGVLLNNFPQVYTSADSSSSSSGTTKKSQCLSLGFEENMEAILSNFKQIFITMPAKAAGTSLKAFTTKCMNQTLPDNFINTDNFINNKNYLSNQFLTNSLQLPSIITSHVVTDQPLINLAKHLPREALIIQIHRDETDRLKSGIKMVLTNRICRGFLGGLTMRKEDIFHRNETLCIVNEGPVVEIIRRRQQEIGFGVTDILTCNTYGAIEQNAPNMVFIHYKQANILQKLFAKHHCPHLLEEPPTQENVAKNKRMEVLLRLKNGGEVVKLDKWLHEKSAFLEWSLQLRQHASCQAKTRSMEDELFACSDKAIKVTSKDVKSW